MSENILSLSLVLLVILPLLIALAMAFNATHAAALKIAPWVALPVLIQTIFLPPAVSLHLPWLLLGGELGIEDDTSRHFLLFTALLWWVAGIYARNFLTDHPDLGRFFVYFLLAMAGNLGLILAQDLASFYLFFALMSFAAYGLVVHERSKAAQRAGRVYITFVVIGEVTLFVAMVLSATTADSTGFNAVRYGLAQTESLNLIIFLVLIGFGIKVGVLGLHLWLPLAYTMTPSPASAVLSGAMVNAGLLGWLRLLPLGEIALIKWGEMFLLLGLAAAFYGVVVGLTQRKPKTLLAYSSISQMGIMTMAVGLGLLAPHAWPVILPVITFYALHHGLSKCALFLSVGFSDNRHRLRTYWIWWGTCLPALALAGAPWTSGMLAKLTLKTQTIHAPAPWDSLLPTMLFASAVATALLMARLLYLLWPENRMVEKPITGLVLPWIINLLAVLLLTWWVAPSIPIGADDMGKNVMDSLWPLLFAAIVVLLVIRFRLLKALQPLPEGDVLILLERAWKALCNLYIRWTALQSMPLNILNGIKLIWCSSIQKGLSLNEHLQKFRTTKDSKDGWTVPITLFVLISIGLAWLAG